MSNKQGKRMRGFTLIEILIVVVILGILAAIIIPQFTNAAQDAGTQSARSQLQTMRSQIELYRIQNAGLVPADAGEADNAGPWAVLVAGGYIRSSPVWPNGFDPAYNATSGLLTLTFDESEAPRPAGLTNDVIAAW